MKKKLVTGALLLAFGAVAVTGGTLAYFTDEDSQKNVMTTGKVDIAQYETQRDGSEFVQFVQDKALMPMVDNRTVDSTTGELEAVVVDGYFNEKMNNVVDKVVTVKNEAEAGAINQEVYVRTILAFETNTEYKEGTTDVLRDGKTIFSTYIGTLGDFELLERNTVKIDGVEYVLAVKVYDEALEPQEMSDPSLKQIFLSPQANNEVALLFGDEYTIIALSQGTQVAGFEDVNNNGTPADDALNRAFGDVTNISDVTDEELIAWLSAAQENRPSV